VGKNTVKGHCMLQRNLGKEESKDVANFIVVFFSEISLPTPTFSNQTLRQDPPPAKRF